MKKRPLSISIIAWLLIASGLISFVSVPLTLNNPRSFQMMQELMAKSPLPVPLQFVLMFLGFTVMVVSGIGILKGQDWARKLYVVWGAFGLLIGFATSPMKLMLIPSLVFLLVVIFFLFRPAANRYFATETASDAQTP